MMENSFEVLQVMLFAKVLIAIFSVAVVIDSLQAQPSDRRLLCPKSVIGQFDRELQLEGGSESVKCGTALVALVHMRWKELPLQAKVAIGQALQRPAKQKSRLSPSGRFRIHYDTTGVDAPALISLGGAPERLANSAEQYVDSVAAIFDFCLRYETDSLGYASPPPDGLQGGGPEYDIYIEELGYGTFGQTSWQESIDLIEDGPRQRYSSYIEIDNDYLGHRTSGMSGLRITAAHELFHAIQVGSYGIWSTATNSFFYFYELTSAWMEDFLFTWINDYYFDVRTYFRAFRDSKNRSYSFTTYLGPTMYGYERSIFAHFLAKRYSRGVIREIWDGMKTEPFLRSVATVLRRHGSTLEAEYAQFSTWNFFTADRADTVRFYDEGKYYPRYVVNASSNFNGLSATITTSGYPLSSQFCQFSVPGDTVTAIVTNIEAAQAEEGSSVTRPFELRLASGQSQPPYQQLSKGYTAGFSSDLTGAWRTTYLEASTRASASTATDLAPNPFHLSKDTHLIVPLQGTVGSIVRIYVLGSSLDLLYSGEYPVIDALGKRVAYLPAADLRSRVPSGIYFVVARCDDAEYTWKIAIFR